MTKSLESKLIPKEARYSVRLRYVIFPLDFRDIRETLAKYGFELTQVGPIPFRPTRISFTGELGRKGESVVYLSTTENIFGVRSKTLEEAMKAFKELSEIIATELDIDLNSNVWYYELTAHYLCKTGSLPIENIAKVIEGNPYFSKFSEVLEREISTFSIRLSPKNKIPNQEEWFDIAIEQDTLKSDSYHVGVVIRSPEKRKIEKIRVNLTEKIERLIKIIEGRE